MTTIRKASARRPMLPGVLIVIGGVAWLGGVVVLVSLMESDEDTIPLLFHGLGALAGLGVALGSWRLSSMLTNPVARGGARLLAASASVIGLGLGGLLQGTVGYLGWVLALGTVSFIAPITFAVLGLGLVGGNDLPSWGGWMALVVAALGAITYLIRGPVDVVWLICIGLGWILVGVAATRPTRT